MGEPEHQGALFSSPGPPDAVVQINDRCMIRTRDGHRVVVVSAVALAQYPLGDRMAEAHAMVSLVEQGWADQNDVARAFGCSPRTVRRHQRRFESGGLPALGRPSGYPKGRGRLGQVRLKSVLHWKSEGLSNREVAHRLGVSEKAVRKLLRRAGWVPAEPRQPRLPLPDSADPNLSAFAAPTEVSTDEPLALSLDTDPADRRLDRLLAYLGLLEDAAPLFRPGLRVPRAGVLLALPALIDSGVLELAHQVYGSLGPAFYGLRTTMLTLLLMALLRIKRPEALKEYSPDELGRLLGLDRAPEVKTLRRKLSRLAAVGRASQFGRALAERRVQARGAALGFLYVDGHVRVYHGKHRLPKAHAARLRLAMPATTDYWVNDAVGDPLFVVTAEANAGLVKMLPEILAEVRTVVGERRLTVVFDRGGFSPRLFQQLIAEGFDLLTYRKGQFRRVPKACFHEQDAVIDGQKVRYKLADQGVQLLDGKLRLRQVTRLCDDEHQTAILTSRRDLTAVEVAFRMFERWRQENFFKYLREEYALDALVDYTVEPDDPARDVPNPERKAVAAQLREARAELTRLQAEYGRAVAANPERLRPTVRGFKIAHGKLGKALRAAMDKVAKLQARQAEIPPRVSVGQAVSGDVIKLAPERKLLTNLLKMIAYQAETDLVRQVSPHYQRAEQEGRTLIHSALQAAANLEVSDTQLNIVLAPLSSPHRTRAIATLCEELNRAPIRFPGTRLRLHYAIAGPR
jgi:DNA-binding CsgD family transcriptional regulator